MEAKKLDGVEVWKEFENVVTRLKLSVTERAVYSHLLLRTRLDGKRRERFTNAEVADNVGVSRGTVRRTIRRLARLRVLRSVERSYKGHLLEVRLPGEVPAARGLAGQAGKTKNNGQSKLPGEPNLEQMDFFTSPGLRQAIHAREGGKCFYCRRRTSARSRCVDHVVPRAKFGENSYRNVVSCCVECNWLKKDHPAEDFLRELYREGQFVPEGPQRTPSGLTRPRCRQAPALLPLRVGAGLAPPSQPRQSFTFAFVVAARLPQAGSSLG